MADALDAATAPAAAPASAPAAAPSAAPAGGADLATITRERDELRNVLRYVPEVNTAVKNWLKGGQQGPAPAAAAPADAPPDGGSPPDTSLEDRFEGKRFLDRAHTSLGKGDPYAGEKIFKEKYSTSMTEASNRLFGKDARTEDIMGLLYEYAQLKAEKAAAAAPPPGATPPAASPDLSGERLSGGGATPPPTRDGVMTFEQASEKAMRDHGVSLAQLAGNY